MGTTSPLIAHRYNWTSMDSGTWFRQAGAALIPVPLLKDGQLDYALSPDIMSLGKYPRGLHIEDLDDYDLGRVNRWLAELGIELTQARTDYQIRQRIWIAYFKNLGLSSSTRIVFVSVFGKLRQVLLQCGAEYHLLSYYQLRDVPDTKLQNYVTGYL